MARDCRPTSAGCGMIRWRFALGCVLAVTLFAGFAEIYLRLFPPCDLYPYLGEASPLTGIYKPDDDFSVTYRSWQAFRDDNANRLGEFLPFEAKRDGRPLWAFFGNSFVQAPGMLADHARERVTDKRIFHLARNEHLFLRFAQIKLLLENGMQPERIFVVLMPVDVIGIGTQPLATNHVTSQGALTYRLPAESSPLSWAMRHSRLGLTAGVRTGEQRRRMNTVYEGVQEPLLGDLRRLFGNLARVARQHEVPVTVLLIPAYHQIRYGASCGFQDMLGPMLCAQGCDVFDPRDAFRGQPELDGLFIPDKHFSPRGNEILLAELLKHLDRHRLQVEATSQVRKP